MQKLRFGKFKLPAPSNSWLHTAYGRNLVHMPEPTHFLLDITHPSRTHQSFKVVRVSKGEPLVLGIFRRVVPSWKCINRGTRKCRRSAQGLRDPFVIFQMKKTGAPVDEGLQGDTWIMKTLPWLYGQTCSLVPHSVRVLLLGAAAWGRGGRKVRSPHFGEALN